MVRSLGSNGGIALPFCCLFCFVFIVASMHLGLVWFLVRCWFQNLSLLDGYFLHWFLFLLSIFEKCIVCVLTVVFPFLCSCYAHKECLLVLEVWILGWVGGRKVGGCVPWVWHHSGKEDCSTFPPTKLEIKLEELDLLALGLAGGAIWSWGLE